MRAYIDRVKKIPYMGSMLLLLSGGGIAQIISFASSPIITRLFSPAEMGVLGVFTVMSNYIGCGACLCYEMGIVQAEENEWAKLAKQCLKIGAIISLILILPALILFFFGQSINPLPSAYWFIVLPLFGIVGAMIKVGTNIATRLGDYRTLVGSRWIGSGLTAVLNIALGFMLGGAGSLLFVVIFTQLIVGFYFAKKTFHHIKHPVEDTPVLKKYKNYPKYTLPSVVLNMTAQNSPVILFALLFGLAEAGLFVLVQRAVNVPLAVVAEALTSIYMKESASEMRENGNCESSFKKFFKYYSIIGLISTLGMLVVGSYLFVYIFGENWSKGGDYMMVLSMMVGIRMVASPLSYTFLLYHKQGIDFLGNLLMLGGASLGIYLGTLTSESLYAVLGYAIALSAIYIFYICYSYSLSKRQLPKLS